jgi:hypothetical protein
MPLPNAPAIALEIPAEQQLRIGRDAIRVGRRERELGFLRDDRLDGVRAAAKMPRDRAKMAAGADHDRRRYFLVDDPCAAFAAQRLDSRGFEHARAGTAQQVIVELAPPNRVADHAPVPRFDRIGSDQPGSETRDVLQRQAGRAVLVWIEVEQLEHSRRQPSRAHFVTRKLRPVGNDHIPSRTPKLTRTRRSGRAAADDERIAANHTPASEISYGSERVHDGGADSRGAKTI